MLRHCSPSLLLLGLLSASIVSAQSSKIVFVSNAGGNFEIWMMHPDGTDRTQITFQPGTSQNHPQLSPDGTAIAYLRCSPACDLWVVNADGSDPHLVRAGVAGAPYDWSTSDWILFSARTTSQCFPDDVRRIRRDGSGESVITNSVNHGAAVLADGETVFFIKSPRCWTPNNEIWQVNISGGLETQVWPADGLAEFFPRAANLSSDLVFRQLDGPGGFQSPGNLYRLDTVTLQKTQLTNASSGEDYIYPAFSPGDDLIVSTFFDSNGADLVILDAISGQVLSRMFGSADDKHPDWGIVVEPNLPPVALCRDLVINANGACLASLDPADIDNGSFDPEANPLIYAIEPEGPLSLGAHSVILTVFDAEQVPDSCSALVRVQDNSSPVPDDLILPVVTGQCSIDVASIPTATDNCSDLVEGQTTDPLNYSSQGTFLVTWQYSDAAGNTAIQGQTIVVEDTTAPNIEGAEASPSVLWPPNHTMREVSISLDVSDNCGDETCQITGVASNEAINGQGDGNTDPDWEITGPLTVDLRAERSGLGTDRIYTITVECTDGAGNTTESEVTVTVPHDQGKQE